LRIAYLPLCSTLSGYPRYFGSQFLSLTLINTI
jgi:hypothetical protein